MKSASAARANPSTPRSKSAAARSGTSSANAGNWPALPDAACAASKPWSRPCRNCRNGRRELPPAAHLGALRQRIEQAQRLARHSGALHAALYFDGHGELRLCREDIGRHNALDKLIGALHRQGLDAARGFAVVTSRCSLELIHKAVRAGIGTLVSLSAPTALTVQWARRHQLNLIHQPHHNAPRVYSPAPAATE